MRYASRLRSRQVDKVLSRQTRIIADRAALKAMIDAAPERSEIVVAVYDQDGCPCCEPMDWKSLGPKGALLCSRTHFLASALARAALDASQNISIRVIDDGEPT